MMNSAGPRVIAGAGIAESVEAAALTTWRVATVADVPRELRESERKVANCSARRCSSASSVFTRSRVAFEQGVTLGGKHEPLLTSLGFDHTARCLAGVERGYAGSKEVVTLGLVATNVLFKHRATHRTRKANCQRRTLDRIGGHAVGRRSVLLGARLHQRTDGLCELLAGGPAAFGLALCTAVALLRVVVTPSAASEEDHRRNQEAATREHAMNVRERSSQSHTPNQRRQPPPLESECEHTPSRRSVVSRCPPRPSTVPSAIVRQRPFGTGVDPPGSSYVTSTNFRPAKLTLIRLSPLRYSIERLLQSK